MAIYCNVRLSREMDISTARNNSLKAQLIATSMRSIAVVTSQCAICFVCWKIQRLRDYSRCAGKARFCEKKESQKRIFLQKLYVCHERV